MLAKGRRGRRSVGAAPRSAGAAPRSAGAARGVSGRISPTLPVPRGAARGRSQRGGEPGHRLCAPRPPLPRTCVALRSRTLLCARGKPGDESQRVCADSQPAPPAEHGVGGGPTRRDPTRPSRPGRRQAGPSARRSRLQTCRPRSSLCSPASVVLLLLLESASPPASPLVSRAAKCRARTVPSRTKRYPLRPAPAAPLERFTSCGPRPSAHLSSLQGRRLCLVLRVRGSAASTPRARVPPLHLRPPPVQRTPGPGCPHSWSAPPLHAEKS